MGACCLSGQSGKGLVTHLDLSEKPDQAKERDKRPGEGGKCLILETYQGSPNEELQKAECRGYSGAYTHGRHRKERNNYLDYEGRVESGVGMISYRGANQGGRDL